MKSLIKLFTIALATIVYFASKNGKHSFATKVCSVMNRIKVAFDLSHDPLLIVWNRFEPVND
jgi:hypothetical protein